MMVKTPKRHSIAGKLMRHAQQQGNTTALQHGQNVLSYAALASSAINVARHLKKQCNNGQSISLCVADPIKFLCAFLGARLCGHNVMVLNHAWPPEMQTQCIDHLRPAFSLNDISINLILHSEHIEDNSDFENPVWQDSDLNEPFYTGFTSGSEGFPKGFTRHENSWLHSFETDAKSYDLSTEDTIVCPGSLAHSLFLYASVRALYTGLRIIFFDGLQQSQQRQDLAEIRSAVLFAVPAHLQTLVDSKSQYKHLRLAVSAGAKLQPKLRKELIKTLPAAQLMECYGSSELSYIALSQPADSPPAGSVGKLCSGVQIRVTDEKYEPVFNGEQGRILIKSPMRFIGYAQPRNSTNLKKMRQSDGFLDSGDTGYLDENGFLFITGRSDRMMLIAGHSIFPEQIEAALSTFDKIKQVAVFPVPDNLRGQRPVAVVKFTTESKPSRSEIRAFIKSLLPDHAVPRHYYSITDWPSTVSEKTDMPKLQAMYQLQLLERLL